MIADDLLMNVSLIMICQNMPDFALKCIGNANSSKLGVVHYFSLSILMQWVITKKYKSQFILILSKNPRMFLFATKLPREACS